MSKRAFGAVGHGGSDPGAVAYGHKEKDGVLITAKKWESELKRHGVEVKLSRGKDENDPLNDEVKECNAYKPDLAIAFHENAGGGDGFEAYYTLNGGKGKELALKCEEEVKKLGQNSRGCKTKKGSNGDYYGWIRNTICPAIIVESFFIDNKNDLKDFDEKHELEALGVAYAKATLRQLGIKYKEDKPSVSKPPTGTNKKETYYRVCVGSFKDKKNAEDQQAKLKAKGFESFLVAYEK